MTLRKVVGSVCTAWVATRHITDSSHSCYLADGNGFRPAAARIHQEVGQLPIMVSVMPSFGRGHRRLLLDPSRRCSRLITFHVSTKAGKRTPRRRPRGVGVLRHKLLHLSHVLKITSSTVHCYCCRGKQPKLQGGFYWRVPSTFANQFCWATAWLVTTTCWAKALWPCFRHPGPFLVMS